MSGGGPNRFSPFFQLGLDTLLQRIVRHLRRDGYKVRPECQAVKFINLRSNRACLSGAVGRRTRHAAGNRGAACNARACPINTISVMTQASAR